MSVLGRLSNEKDLTMQKINPKWYKTKRSTKVYTDETGMHCVYHSTRVVSWTPTKVILRSGGYRSLTTRTRMREVSHQYGLGFSVYQKKWAWYVSFYDHRDPLEFYEGISFDTKNHHSSTDCDLCKLDLLKELAR